MLTNNPVINFESATLKSKLTNDINNCLTTNVLQEIQQSPFTYNAAYEQFLKNLYITIMHGMICDTDLSTSRIKFSIVDIPLIEPITLVEDESGGLLHVLSRSLMRRVFHHKGNFKIVDDTSSSSTGKPLPIFGSSKDDCKNKNNESEVKKSPFSPTMMLKLKDTNVHPDLDDEAIYLSGVIQEKLILCYVVAEHAVMHYCQYIINRDNPDYEHSCLDDLSSKRSKYIFLYKLITTQEDRNIHKYIGA